MANPPLCLVTPRDLDLFRALDRGPLTIRQMLKLSATFAYPFTTERRVQERLHRLCAAGRVHRWVYATAGQGAVSYFTLTPLGYQLLHGPDAPTPNRGHFRPIGIARQRHARALAEAIVHTMVSAHRARVGVADFHAENALRLTVGSESLYPDSALDLVQADTRPFHFYVELDNSTEAIGGLGNVDTWQRKAAFYERFQDSQANRFRVLVFTTGRPERLHHILACAASAARNLRRSLIYGIGLSEYLAESDPLRSPCFRDHRGRPVALVLAPVAQPSSLELALPDLLPFSPAPNCLSQA